MINSVYPFLLELARNFMGGGKTLAAIGSIIGIFGFAFHLQGQAIVGPQSSFMYSNPDWITFGMQMMLAGIIILVIGVIIFKKN